MSDGTSKCGECGMLVGFTYHPFLHCELYKLGHLDPHQYLTSYGYTRPPETTAVMDADHAVRALDGEQP